MQSLVIHRLFEGRDQQTAKTHIEMWLNRSAVETHIVRIGHILELDLDELGRTDRPLQAAAEAAPRPCSPLSPPDGAGQASARRGAGESEVGGGARARAGRGHWGGEGGGGGGRTHLRHFF
jgi:hypothetical protein